MSTHSVAEARNQLSLLIGRALAGEPVVITRHGHPIIELRPVRSAAGAVSADDLDWLATGRVPLKQACEDAGTLVSRMRDDDER
jgi:prevent-host-death family protein